MVKEKDLKVVKNFKEKLKKKIPLDKVILFGSRANGKTHEWSDFDIIVVSDSFKTGKRYERVPAMYDYWNEDYPVDFICLTKKEFEKLKKRITIVKEALETGIVV